MGIIFFSFLNQEMYMYFKQTKVQIKFSTKFQVHLTFYHRQTLKILSMNYMYVYVLNDPKSGHHLKYSHLVNQSMIIW